MRMHMHMPSLRVAPWHVPIGMCPSACAHRHAAHALRAGALGPATRRTCEGCPATSASAARRSQGPRFEAASIASTRGARSRPDPPACRSNWECTCARGQPAQLRAAHGPTRARVALPPALPFCARARAVHVLALCEVRHRWRRHAVRPHPASARGHACACACASGLGARPRARGRGGPLLHVPSLPARRPMRMHMHMPSLRPAHKATRAGTGRRTGRPAHKARWYLFPEPASAVVPLSRRFDCIMPPEYGEPGAARP